MRFSTTLLALSFGFTAAACGSNTIVQKNDAPPADQGDPGASQPADYPAGPYGTNAGQILGDRDFKGYVRFDATGLASAASTGLESPVKLSDVRARALAPAADGTPSTLQYTLVHLTAYWCPICKASIEDLEAQYPKYSSKAIFVDALIEGIDPDTAVTQQNLTSWIKFEEVPFTTLMDPDGSTFGTRKALGEKDTTYLVDLPSMKIVYKGDYQVALTKIR